MEHLVPKDKFDTACLAGLQTIDPDAGYPYWGA
jgi:hypothetical protein